MPHVVVKRWPGKSEEQKIALADAITRDVMQVLDYPEEAVSVAFEEVEARDWAGRVYRPEIRDKWDQVYKKPGYEMEWTRLRHGARGRVEARPRAPQ
jgi:4-oxalocrotonate tautomerase